MPAHTRSIQLMKRQIAWYTPQPYQPPRISGFVLVWALQIQWLSMTFSMTFSIFPGPYVKLSVKKNSKNFLVLEHFFDLNRHHLWRPPKCMPFALFNDSSLSYIVLALSSAGTNLSHKLQFSMTFKDRQLNSMTFQAWKMKFLNSMTFQVFHDLYEPSLPQPFSPTNAGLSKLQRGRPLVLINRVDLFQKLGRTSQFSHLKPLLKVYSVIKCLCPYFVSVTCYTSQQKQLE